MLALLFVTLPFVVRTVQPVLHRARPRDGGGRRLARRAPLHDLPAVVLPNLLPAILVRRRRSRFARALGEFGSVVLISGNIPFKTEVASVYIFGQIESDDVTGAAAVSVVLLADLARRAPRDRRRAPLGARAHDR